MTERIDQIIIAETEGRRKIFGNLKRCEVCRINFTALQPCIICSAVIEQERELGRQLTRDEYDKILGGLNG